MIQQSASRVAKEINKQQKSTISYPTRALMTKSREMVTIYNEQSRQKYAGPTKRMQERTSGNTTMRSYEKRSWHQKSLKKV